MALKGKDQRNIEGSSKKSKFFLQKKIEGLSGQKREEESKGGEARNSVVDQRVSRWVISEAQRFESNQKAIEESP